MSKFRKLSHFEISKERFSPGNLKKAQRQPIYAILDNIRSMYNVGSIFRSSDGAFLEKIYLTGYTPTPEKNEVRKTALGASDTIPWEYVKDPALVIKQLKRKNVSIVVLEQTTNSVPYFELPNEIFPVCIAVGNEISGISDSILENADYSVEIPMFGTKQSLNVAVAYGILLFDLLRIYKSV